MVEPAFACAYKKEGAEIHGLAFALSPEEKEKINKMEGGYAKAMIELQLYDGRKVEGQIYTSKKDLTDVGLPSKRYMSLVIQGTREAKLDPSYIEAMVNTPTYEPSQDTIEKRALAPDP